MQLFKTCGKCKEAKPLDLFGKNKALKDGLHYCCKICKNEMVKKIRATPEGREKHRAATREASRKIRETPEGLEKQRKSGRVAYHKKCATPEGREKYRNANRKSGLVWAKNHPEKALANVNKRRAIKLQAIPKWFDKDKVDLVYAKAKLWGMHVDHVIPLRGKNVCGLHVWENLQLLNESLNKSKGNRHYE
jgi:hypothetical protein